MIFAFSATARAMRLVMSSSLVYPNDTSSVFRSDLRQTHLVPFDHTHHLVPSFDTVLDDSVLLFMPDLKLLTAR